MNAYNAPTGNILLGTSQTELRLLMRNERPTSTENVVVNDVEYTKEVYADKNLYFDADGRLAIVEVTRLCTRMPSSRRWLPTKRLSSWILQSTGDQRRDQDSV